MPDYPTSNNIRDWRVKLAMAANVAGNRGDQSVWNWMNQSMKTANTWDQLGNVPREFQVLDLKLAQGLISQLPKWTAQD